MTSQLLKKVRLEKDDLEEYEIRRLEKWVNLSSLPVKKD